MRRWRTKRTQSLDKKLVRTSPVLWILGVVFAVLLGAIGTQALSDIADLFREPQLETYRAPRTEAIERERSALLATPDPQQEKIARAERDLADEERTLATAEESWRTWLATRATLGVNAAAARAPPEVPLWPGALDPRPDFDASHPAVARRLVTSLPTCSRPSQATGSPAASPAPGRTCATSRFRPDQRDLWPPPRTSGHTCRLPIRVHAPYPLLRFSNRSVL